MRFSIGDRAAIIQLESGKTYGVAVATKSMAELSQRQQPATISNTHYDKGLYEVNESEFFFSDEMFV